MIHSPSTGRRGLLSTARHRERVDVAASVGDRTASRASLRPLVARALRFALVGGVCGLLQLLLFVLLEQMNTHAAGANVVAYLLSAQVNFLLSDLFIWGDRRTNRDRGTIGLRWLSFHLSIGGTFVLDQAVFLAARVTLPDVLASAAGIGVAALVNFAIQDRFTFQSSRSSAVRG